MKKTHSYIVFVALVGLTLCSGIGCHLLLPFESKESTNAPYYCSAQIYRELPGGKEFTEQWELYTWAYSQTDAYNDATTKINNYISKYMAPGFTWYYRNLTAVSTVKENAVDCAFTWDNKPISPPTYGAPIGVELRWNYPSTLQGYAYFSMVDQNGVTQTAEPVIANAHVDYAERTGLPDSTGNYVIGQRHIRFSDIYIELDTPFTLSGGLTVNKFYVQNTGTVIAQDTGGTAYQVAPYDSKYFVYAEGAEGGNTDTSSFCFVNESLYGFTEYEGLPYQFFTFSIDLNTTISGYNMTIKLSLSKPAAPYSFDSTQPYVALSDKVATAPPLTLEVKSSDVVYDPYYELTRYLWFENFESSSEKFLGEGNPLNNVQLSAGDHEITLVVYNSKGAYNSATMTLTGVPNVPPVATNDFYSVDENTILTVSSSNGVLKNDTSANGYSLTAIKVSDPANGTLTLNADGSFIYKPNTNFHGTDSFTYKAYDGKAYSNIATATITVNFVNQPPVAMNDNYSVDQDSTLTVPAPGVLGNDTDPENDPLTAIKVNNPANGSLTLNSNGSFTYTPKTAYSGADSFTYKANDGYHDSNIATVTIKVNYLSPDQEIQKQLEKMVNDLVTAGALNSGQGNSLLSKLDQAITKIKAGAKTVGCNLLTAFINEVQSLISTGVLTPAQGQPLIDKALTIKGELGC